MVGSVEDAIESSGGAFLGDATTADVLAGKNFSSSEGINLAGTMANNARVGATSEFGSTTNADVENGANMLYFRLDEGYYPNTAWRGTKFSNLGDAALADVLENKKFTAGVGLNRKGTMPNRGNKSKITFGGYASNSDDLMDDGTLKKDHIVFHIPYGYYSLNNSSQQTGLVYIEKSYFGDVAGSEVLSGKKYTSANGLHASGTMPNRGAVTKTLAAGEEYTIPNGYHNGSGKVTAPTLSSLTNGTATSADILLDKTA